MNFLYMHCRRTLFVAWGARENMVFVRIISLISSRPFWWLLKHETMINKASQFSTSVVHFLIIRFRTFSYDGSTTAMHPPRRPRLWPSSRLDKRLMRFVPFFVPFFVFSRRSAFASELSGKGTSTDGSTGLRRRSYTSRDTCIRPRTSTVSAFPLLCALYRKATSRATYWPKLPLTLSLFWRL